MIDDFSNEKDIFFRPYKANYISHHINNSVPMHPTCLKIKKPKGVLIFPNKLPP